MMNVILLQRVEKLGQMGDVVTVKPGYARNYLLPQGIAASAAGVRPRRTTQLFELLARRAQVLQCR